MKSQARITIVSGGQTGVDRGALDFALANGFACKGWCTQGRLAEDGIINVRYPLNETNSVDPVVRTEMNVVDSDATLIIYMDDLDKGSQAARDFAFEYRKPMFMWRIGKNDTSAPFLKWLGKNEIQILNIAGPRASNAPDIYGETLDLLNLLLHDFIKRSDLRIH